MIKFNNKIGRREIRDFFKKVFTRLLKTFFLFLATLSPAKKEKNTVATFVAK